MRSNKNCEIHQWPKTGPSLVTLTTGMVSLEPCNNCLSLRVTFRFVIWDGSKWGRKEEIRIVEPTFSNMETMEKEVVSMAKIPFLFRVVQETSDESLWIIKLASVDYIHYNSSWMDDEALGSTCLVPDVDLVKEEFQFASEKEALQKMKDLWSQVDLGDSR